MKQKKDLKEKLENFSTSHPDVKDIKILVVGQIEAGKSSFINSIESAFQARISSRALVNSADGYCHSFTKTVEVGEKKMPFVFKDVMGLQPKVLEGLQTEDIINAVFGHVRMAIKFNQEQALAHTDQHYTCDPELSDQSFCLVYVIDAKTVEKMDNQLIDKLTIIRQRISDKGIPQVVVMTKVDEACPLVGKDLRKIYSSKKIKEKMELCSAKVGVPLTNIFPVKNYHYEIDTNDDVDVLILKAVEQIVHLADDRLKTSESY
ncbi:interferon-induced protein 44-like [Labeo rohita]|uniref:interferon-induced protein 44-like n=1 Tax=Labeo rohita TaxID=84645 RepID=UPI0021E29943|nr:interferon-induced protein 44-like [Labeo rohita]